MSLLIESSLFGFIGMEHRALHMAHLGEGCEALRGIDSGSPELRGSVYGLPGHKLISFPPNPCLDPRLCSLPLPLPEDWKCHLSHNPEVGADHLR